MERLIIRQEGKEIHFEMSIKEAIDMLQKYADEGWTDIEEKFYHYTDHSDYCLINLRPETDEEYESRLKIIEQSEEIAKEQRRKQYEELKKEFGDS
jgi:hypothetical protein